MKLHQSLILLYVLVSIIPAASPITIHVYNPWIDNPYRQDSLFIYGNNEVGYGSNAGTRMESDGGGWFTYTFTTMPVNINDGFGFVSYVGTQYYSHANEAKFPDSQTITFQYLSTNFAGSTEFWIIPEDSLRKYNAYNIPPKSKVIHFFNAWPDNSPQIVISGSTPKRMRVNTNICGWYTYYYSGFIDSLKQVYFTDYFHTSKYMSGGLVGGNPLDLSTILANKDTIYIVPKPFPSGPPSISTTFPGKTGECPLRKISAIVRDWKVDNTSFFLAGSITGGKVIKGMVQSQLSDSGKPVAAANASAGHGSALGSWFITSGGNQTCVDLTFTKGYDGRWEFDSDLMGGFFPIDNFDNPNNIKYPDEFKRMHNFHFTMEMHMQFVYRKGANQTFMFRGDDDVWIFVNNKLAIDLGSLHEAASDTLILDQDAATLGLTDGGNYSMDIFYCERQPTGSNLLIRTSLDLRNSEDLFYKETLISAGKMKYDIRQLVKTNGLDCGFTPVLNQEEAAIVDFSLDGPQFQGTPVALPPGTYYGGITVDPSKSMVTIDSAAIKGLSPGLYTITFTSTLNKDRSGYLTFNVVGKLPASLFADPPDGSHFVTKTEIKLTTDDKARIYFTTDGTNPDTTNPAQLYSGPIPVSKSLTIKAIAIGDDYLPTSGSFKYTRDPEKIVLTANPPDGTHFIKDTTVTLTASIKEARIYYTSDGTAPDTSNPAQLYSNPIPINKSVTIKAIAIAGEYFTAASGSFKYIRDPETISLTANPPDGTHFMKDTTVSLFASNGAKIYYTTDGSNPDTNNASQLYSAPFKITGTKSNLSTTVKAIAIGDYLVPISKSWTYTRDLQTATLTATPGNGTHFGESLSIILSTNADAIYYTIDGSNPVEGSAAQLYKGPFTITDDTVIVKAIAAGNDFVSISKQFKYISDRVPSVQANPGSCAFSKPLIVKLTVNDLTATIYYTLDGSEPTVNSTPYKDPITISTTTQLKARAFASNKVPSSILTENYTRKSIPLEAFYYDRNADGIIDSFSVKLDLKASAIPDSILISAYGSMVKRTIRAAQLKLSGDGLYINSALEPPLTYENSKSNDSGSGVIEGQLFDRSVFDIQDKVAPVLKSATFAPDVLEENMSQLGTLKIKFSEPVKSINSEYPFNFYQAGTQYKLKLKLISISLDDASFTVISVDGVNFPKNGDFVNIAPSQGIKDIAENEQNNPDNIKIPMKVLPQPYSINFQIGPNPFETGVSSLSSLAGSGISITSGTAIVADFKANLKTDAEKIKADILIYDPVGNIVCSASENRSINGILEVKKFTNIKTKVIFAWSGRNKSGRKVGTGSYMTIIRLTDPSDTKVTKEFMIGVKN
jgi:fibro-slime domain-containing protein